MRKRRIITICSSVSFYKEILEIEKSLKNIGFSVIVPTTAKVMKKSGNFDALAHKTWFADASDYPKKAAFMRDHFKKVLKADAILVINLTKNGKKGYIGPNVLMEMGFAFYHKKSIYIWNSVSSTSFEEEIMGMNPIIINQDLLKIT